MKTTLRLSETLAVKAEAAVVLAALPFLTKRLRCHQVHIAWDLNSVPISLSILRHIPYMVLSAPHSHRNVALPGNHLLKETAGLLLRAGSTPQPLPDGLRCPPSRVSPPQHLGQTANVAGTLVYIITTYYQPSGIRSLFRYNLTPTFSPPAQHESPPQASSALCTHQAVSPADSWCQLTAAPCPVEAASQALSPCLSSGLK